MTDVLLDELLMHLADAADLRQRIERLDVDEDDHEDAAIAFEHAESLEDAATVMVFERQRQLAAMQ